MNALSRTASHRKQSGAVIFLSCHKAAPYINNSLVQRFHPFSPLFLRKNFSYSEYFLSRKAGYKSAIYKNSKKTGFETERERKALIAPVGRESAKKNGLVESETARVASFEAFENLITPISDFLDFSKNDKVGKPPNPGFRETRSDILRRQNGNSIIFSDLSPANERSDRRQKAEKNRVLKKLKKTIRDVYKKHQIKNWDGFGAEPLIHPKQALDFAKSLFFKSPELAESADIIPENDGCLCFEWYKSDKQFITVSVKGCSLIYNYRKEEEEGCGETNIFGKNPLIDRIQRIIGR